MPPASTIGPSKNAAHRAHEHERIEPAGLAARARRQQHQPVGAGRDRALGMADRWRRRRTPARRHHAAAPSTGAGEPTEVMTISGLCRSSTCRSCCQPRIGAMHDQVRADRRRWLAALRRNAGATGFRSRSAIRRVVRGCGNSPSETSRSRRCGRRRPRVRRRRPETSAPRSAAG